MGLKEGVMKKDFGMVLLSFFIYPLQFFNVK